MPKQLFEIKDFVHISRRKDAKKVTIYKKKGVTKTKFKLRTKRYLYTLVLTNKEKAKKLIQSISPGKSLIYN